jgi:hypothetical protein
VSAPGHHALDDAPTVRHATRIVSATIGMVEDPEASLTRFAERSGAPPIERPWPKKKRKLRRKMADEMLWKRE